jgi:hypothetical protein
VNMCMKSPTPAGGEVALSRGARALLSGIDLSGILYVSDGFREDNVFSIDRSHFREGRRAP